MKKLFGKKSLCLFLTCVLVLTAMTGCRKSTDEIPAASSEEAPVQQSSEVEEATTEEVIDVPEETEGIETIALFGVDTRATNLNKGTRSDSIMVAVINHSTKEVRIASLLRDTYVDIEGHGLTKLTHAHSYGGPELAMETVNKNFDFKIEDYFTVNFLNVRDLVDELGGIEMEITESEAKYINTYIDQLNKLNNTSSANITSAGDYTLDGTQAVAYSRIRYTAGGDYKRAERQRTVLFKIFEKAKDLDNKNLLKLMNDFMEVINTNYSKAKLTKILFYLSKYEIVETKAYPTKLWGGKIGKLWYAVPVTLQSNVEDMHEFLYPDVEYTPSDTVRSISNTIEGYASTPNEDLDNDPSLNHN